MSQAGAKGPASPVKPPPIPPGGGASPPAPGVTPKAPAAAAAGAAPKAATVVAGAAPKAAASLAPKAPKGPPPLPPESGPDVGARAAAEPMRPRLETAPGIGTGADTPRTPDAVPREEIQTLIRAAVAEGAAGMLAEATRLFHSLERRIVELERRTVELEHRPAAVLPAPPPMGQPAPVRADVMGAVPAAAYAPVPVSRAPMPLAPTLDVAQIERDVHVEIDSALDGGRRKRRLLILVVVVFLLVFGGLFGLLAQSYSHHG
jgi:hypothetical protein